MTKEDDFEVVFITAIIILLILIAVLIGAVVIGKIHDDNRHDVENIVVINFGEDEPCYIVFDSKTESEDKE